ncbi:MAG TPA: glycosyltransferase [Gemmatimonadales bacterium]|jgi:glycosyltransferase involved in cell wall biosynthesis|nr:glycosyltransferase [Gemmatimonadales bacterium]
MHEISVVIPTHQRCELLSRTLHSVFAQLEVDIEVIIVDDGSTDGTSALVSGLGDPRIRLIRHERALGVSAARNRGVMEATGEWVAFLDDDDLWAPEKLARQLDAVRRSHCEWAYCGAVAVSPALHIIAGGPPPMPDRLLRDLPRRNTVPAGSSNVFVRRALLHRVGPFDLGLRHMADWDLWIRLGQAARPAVVDRALVAYLLHVSNASADSADVPAEMSLLEARYAAVRGSRRVDRAYIYRWVAWNALRSGRRGTAVRAYARAVLAGDLPSLARAVVGVLNPALAGRPLPSLVGKPWGIEAAAWLHDMACR